MLVPLRLAQFSSKGTLELQQPNPCRGQTPSVLSILATTTCTPNPPIGEPPWDPLLVPLWNRFVPTSGTIWLRSGQSVFELDLPLPSNTSHTVTNLMQVLKITQNSDIKYGIWCRKHHPHPPNPLANLQIYVVWFVDVLRVFVRGSRCTIKLVAGGGVDK